MAEYRVLAGLSRKNANQSGSARNFGHVPQTKAFWCDVCIQCFRDTQSLRECRGRTLDRAGGERAHWGLRVGVVQPLHAVATDSEYDPCEERSEGAPVVDVDVNRGSMGSVTGSGGHGRFSRGFRPRRGEHVNGATICVEWPCSSLHVRVRSRAVPFARGRWSPRCRPGPCARGCRPPS